MRDRLTDRQTERQTDGWRNPLIDLRFSPIPHNSYDDNSLRPFHCVDGDCAVVAAACLICLYCNWTSSGDNETRAEGEQF